MPPEVSEIITYPIKSLKGIHLQSSNILSTGLEYDRQWMLTDSSGNFISQRTYPTLAKIEVKKTESGLHCMYKNSDIIHDLHIPFSPENLSLRGVRVWSSEFQALSLGSDYDDWFSHIVGEKLRLIFMDKPGARKKNLHVKPYSTNLSFTDAYPILITNQASFEDLNGRLEIPVGKARFRANIWVKNLPPYMEENLNEFSIGNVRFKMIKPCARCIVINIDQKSASVSNEPLSTLSKYKKNGNKVFFGIYAICLDNGKIECGQKLIL